MRQSLAKASFVLFTFATFTTNIQTAQPSFLKRILTLPEETHPDRFDRLVMFLLRLQGAPGIHLETFTQLKASLMYAIRTGQLNLDSLSKILSALQVLPEGLCVLHAPPTNKDFDAEESKS